MKHLKNFNESKKPGPKVVKQTKLDYHGMIKYLERKFNFESRGFSGIPSQGNQGDRYMDYWHYLIDINDEAKNGSYISIPEKVEIKKIDTIQFYKDLIKMYPKDKKIVKNAEIMIKREEEARKNPKVDPFENWKQKITDLIFEEFGEYAKGEDGERYLEVWIEW